MNIKYFPNFVRFAYPALGKESNEVLLEIGAEYKKYLEEKYKHPVDRPHLEIIWDIDPKTILKYQGSLQRPSGYHPAFIMGFDEFVRLPPRLKRNKN